MIEYKEFSFPKNRTYREVMDGFLPSLAEYYETPQKYNIEPFRIFGNLYYVGDRMVCMHLVDTGAGLILFDSGYAHNFDSLVSSIETLGFRCADIRYVIHSHGHFDHFGGGNRLRERYGAKIMMSEVDTALIREMPERTLIHLAPKGNDGICYPDVTLADGDVISLGNTHIRCVLAPGHTAGTMAFFFDATDGAVTHKVGYLGGLGFLSIYKEYCRAYKLPENMCDQMIATAKKLANEHVDILLGNHPNHNCTLEKREYMIAHPESNPFVNTSAWRAFLSAIEERSIDFKKLGY
jgi:metallo-beta-lactamase class B